MIPEPSFGVERRLLAESGGYLAAVDEVGRGALAGPVTVGAVLIDATCGTAPEGLRDSKLLSAAARQRLVEPIRSWAVASAVGHASPDEIDRSGIMAALTLAAIRALAGLGRNPDIVLLDGTVDFLNPPLDLLVGAGRRSVINSRVVTRVKADRDCASVAAASIMAKVARDALMTGLAADHPEYGWERNKGYGTADHATAIARYGASDHHRRSWRLPTTIDSGHNGDRVHGGGAAAPGAGRRAGKDARRER